MLHKLFNLELGAKREYTISIVSIIVAIHIHTDYTKMVPNIHIHKEKRLIQVLNHESYTNIHTYMQNLYMCIYEAV